MLGHPQALATHLCVKMQGISGQSAGNLERGQRGLSQEWSRLSLSLHTEDVDVFAIYIPQRDVILFLSVDQVLKARGTTVMRVAKPKNNQTKKINWFEDYLDFKRALRDHTQSTRTS